LQRSRTTSALRLLGWGLLGVLGLGLLAMLAGPQLVRGPRLVALVQRALPPMQGQLRIGGGALGWDTAFALALGRTVSLRLDNVDLRDPEGVEVLWAARLRATVQIERDPLRITLHRLRPGVARWRFARMRSRPGIGFLAAFRPPPRARVPPAVPPVPPTPVAPARRPAPVFDGRPPASFDIVDADLDGLSVTFDFPGWGLVLDDLRGRGYLAIRAPAGGGPPAVAFDVRGIDARRGGSLRFLRGLARTVVPFDRVGIDRVGTSGLGGQDLLLLVREGATGRSRLSGRAQFGGVMASRRLPPSTTPALQIDAEWERAADALTAVARARGLDDLQASGEQSHVSVRLQSSFRDVDGTFLVRDLNLAYLGHQVLDLSLEVTAEGPPYRAVLRQIRFRSPGGGQVEAAGALGPYGRTRLRLRLGNVHTAPWLPDYLRPLLGGVASGYLAARGDMRSDNVTLEGLDVALARTRRGPLPRHFRLHLGAYPVTPPAAAPEESLVASLRGLRWDGGRLALLGLQAEGFGGRMFADAALAVRDPQRRPLRTPALDVRLGVQGFQLEQALPGSGLRGGLSFALDAHGPLDAIAGRLAFPQGGTLSIFDQAYQLPRGAAVFIRGNELSLPRVDLGAPGGGSVSVGGKLAPDRLVDLEVQVSGHRLERVPFVARALPSLAGRLDGRLRLRGPPQRPSLAGDVRLTGVSLRGVALGDGTIALRPARGSKTPGETALHGELFRHLSLRGAVGLGLPSPHLDAALTVRALRLDPFLPSTPLLRGGRLTVSGRMAVAADARRPLLVTGDFEQIALELGCTPPSPAAGCLRLANVGPVRLRSEGGPRHLELGKSRLRTASPAPDAAAAAGETGSDVTVSGVLEDGTIAASLEGRLGADLAAPLLRRSPVTVRGALLAAVQARGSLQAPRLAGTLRVGRPVSVRVRPLPWDVRLVSGQVSFDETGVTSDGLGFEAPGARLRLAGDAPFGTSGDANRPLRVELDGTVAGDFLARLFPAIIATADGQLTVAGRMGGSLRDPTFSGHASLGPLDLRLRFQDTRVAIRSGHLRASGKKLLLENLIADVSPGGQVRIGSGGRPAEVEILSLYPLLLGQVRLPAAGERLSLELPWLSLRGTGFNLLLVGHASRGPLVLRGDVDIGVGRYAPGKQPKKGQGAGSRLARRLPSSVRQEAMPLDLDLQLRGQRLTVDPGWLPDVHLGVDVRVGGTTAKPAVNWRASGKGLYSVIALFIYRLFS
jgi:hypothetical protein